MHSTIMEGFGESDVKKEAVKRAQAAGKKMENAAKGGQTAQMSLNKEEQRKAKLVKEREAASNASRASARLKKMMEDEKHVKKQLDDSKKREEKLQSEVERLKKAILELGGNPRKQAASDYHARTHTPAWTQQRTSSFVACHQWRAQAFHGPKRDEQGRSQHEEYFRVAEQGAESAVDAESESGHTGDVVFIRVTIQYATCRSIERLRSVPRFRAMPCRLAFILETLRFLLSVLLLFDRVSVCVDRSVCL